MNNKDKEEKVHASRLVFLMLHESNVDVILHKLPLRRISCDSSERKRGVCKPFNYGMVKNNHLIDIIRIRKQRMNANCWFIARLRLSTNHFSLLLSMRIKHIRMKFTWTIKCKLPLSHTHTHTYSLRIIRRKMDAYEESMLPFDKPLEINFNFNLSGSLEKMRICWPISACVCD